MSSTASAVDSLPTEAGGPAIVAPAPVSAEEVLRLVEATSTATGQEFFRSLVRHLAGALGMRYALVGELVAQADGAATGRRVRTRAVWTGDAFAENFEYDLEGSPSQTVIEGGASDFPRDVASHFPADARMGEMGVQSYLGASLFDISGEPLGVLAVMHDRPSDGGDGPPDTRRRLSRGVLRIFAARAAAELQRLRREEAIQQSALRYQALADTVPVGIYNSDPTGACIWASERCGQITGVPTRECLGAGWARNIHPDDRERVVGRWAETVRSPTPYQLEFRFLHDDGRIVWVFCQARPERDGTGRLTGFLGSITDITPVKQAEERMRASEHRYQALAETSAVGIWHITFTGDTLYLNPTMRQMLELDPFVDAAEVRFSEFFTPESTERARAEHARRALGHATSYEVELIGRRGRRRSIVVSGAPVRDTDGVFRTSVATLTDVTDQRADERRVRVLAGQAPVILWTTDTSLVFTSAMGSGIARVGSSPESLIGRTIAEIFQWTPASETPMPPAVFAHYRALQGHSMRYEAQLDQWIHDCSTEPLRAADGSVIGVIGVALDVTERKRAEDELRRAHDTLERRVLERTAELTAAKGRAEAEARRAEEAAESSRRLAREVDHRVGNNLNGLQGLVSTMQHRAAGSTDVAGFAVAVESRLSAMAQVHKLLAKTAFQSASLSTLVPSLLQMAAKLGGAPARLEIDGPAIAVAARQVLPLSLILMEWFTNSCKYGAHSRHGGHLRIQWDRIDLPAFMPLDGGPAAVSPGVRLRWIETGGPPILTPVTPSLGTELVHGFASVELQGTCELRYPPSGADHQIDFPLA